MTLLIYYTAKSSSKILFLKILPLLRRISLVLQAKEKDDTLVKLLSFVRDKADPSFISGDSDEENEDRNSSSSSDDNASNHANTSHAQAFIPKNGKETKVYKPHIPGRVLYIYRYISREGHKFSETRILDC